MRVLVVDDSALIRNILKSIFAETADISVAGEASNGQAAAEMVKSLKPDLVLMDINMPVMNGLEATEKIMKESPLPICIFSNDTESDYSMKALGKGALEVLRKPDIDRMNDPEFLRTFLERLRVLSKVNVKVPSKTTAREPDNSYRAVVIGASTGGPAALRDLFKAMPADFPLGIALVQHIEERFDKSFAAWLDSQTSLKVSLASGGEEFLPGKVWVAPGNCHLVVREGRLELEDSPKILNQKPSVDRLFVTAGEYFRKNLLSVLLTGMGSDGAAGTLFIKEKGGYTIVQDESTSTIFGMPRAAIERGGAVSVLPLSGISNALVKLAGRK